MTTFMYMVKVLHQMAHILAISRISPSFITNSEAEAMFTRDPFQTD